MRGFRGGARFGGTKGGDIEPLEIPEAASWIEDEDEDEDDEDESGKLDWGEETEDKGMLSFSLDR